MLELNEEFLEQIQHQNEQLDEVLAKYEFEYLGTEPI